MAWPDLTEFHEAVQSPKRSFKDPTLQECIIEVDRFGMPKPATGANAVVYRATAKNGDVWAIRCFLRPITDHAERYAAISKHLQTLEPDYGCHFDFITEGIKVKGKWYPIVKMEWIGGKLLHLYVESKLKTLGSMASLRDKWRKLAKQLEDAKIAHGDLQQGNILVPQNNFLLIDYDGMWVPSLSGRKGTEIGHRAFQHPKRTQEDYGPTLDRFSALVIYLSIEALERRPTLWEKFHNGDNLLFVQDDFVSPGKTPIWKSLASLKSTQIDHLTECLIRALERPPTDTPALETLLKGVPTLPSWLDQTIAQFRSKG